MKQKIKETFQNVTRIKTLKNDFYVFAVCLRIGKPKKMLYTKLNLGNRKKMDRRNVGLISGQLRGSGYEVGLELAHLLFAAVTDTTSIVAQACTLYPLHLCYDQARDGQTNTRVDESKASRGRLKSNSHRPPDTTKQCRLCRVRRCELSLETVWQSLNS